MSRTNPLHASFPSPTFLLASGIAIFHLSTARVVLLRHPSSPHYFLPKGRKNASESLTTAAVREGYEESGYRCRLVPLPIAHRQPVEEGWGAAGTIGAGDGGARGDVGRFVTEPVWMEMVPAGRRGQVQYVLFWWVGETIEQGEEGRCEGVVRERGGTIAGDFVEPGEAWGKGWTVKGRKEMDNLGEGKGWREPVCHEGTGVDSDEALYEKFLVPVEEAIRLLEGTVMAEVVRIGWAAFQKREEMEEGVS
ncbi:hypothetical protein B9Z65_1327 [Elsinoe australis]|uniref:Nudix hydrolase domain-containing protein n=1 Tax=Elsinoe australis TaxID=40998 RepID=A0A2P7YQC0_9PEZI|nr:hypothetical protein B9Z65_1327 [Elsinoe australis]